jgi:hypothetical protein
MMSAATGMLAVIRVAGEAWSVPRGRGLGGGALVGFEIGQNGLITTALNCDMATFVYRCPTTGLNVQGWFADGPSEHEGEVYETMMCVACTREHLINRSTGRVLGGDDE